MKEKRYQVQFFSKDVSGNVLFTLLDDAVACYDEAMSCGEYPKGELISMETGEVLAHFEWIDYNTIQSYQSDYLKDWYAFCDWMMEP